MRPGPLLPLVALGGAAGALARWALGLALPHSPTTLPVATLLVNLAGALLVGLLAGAVPSAVRIRALLGTGFCGGLTTASTLALELDQLLARAPAVALVYLALTLLLGLGLCQTGRLLGARVAR